MASFHAIGQFYYKDLVTTQQINETFRAYKANKVGKVTLTSFQGEVPVTEGFVCEQSVNLAGNEVMTYTKTADAGESYFTAFYTPQGLLSKTIDSTEETVSTSVYAYDASNRIVKLSHESHATDNHSRTTESHLWQYSSAGKPQKMIRVKNESDTTIVNLKTDDNGNVTEEEGIHKGTSQGKTYYYYDAKNRLTDVVRYNVKARRLLPDYMFEYEDSGELSTMTLVPEGSNDYQKWYYKYDDNGLKAVEFCYNKKKELQGKVEYKYTEGRKN